MSPKTLKKDKDWKWEVAEAEERRTRRAAEADIRDGMWLYLGKYRWIHFQNAPTKSEVERV